MSTFTQNYQDYLQSVSLNRQSFGFDPDTIAQVEPLLGFLYKSWWQIEFAGLEHLPKEGPALIVGNTGGVLPWPGIMLLYALMTRRESPRRLNIVCDLNWIDDERCYAFLKELGFVPYSTANVKELLSQGELVAIFPEGWAGMTKPFSQRYRVSDFDWTRLTAAAESGVKVFPLATLGCDEAVPVFANLKSVARWLKLPAFPLTPFFPWLPYPLSMLLSLPGKWKMRLLKDCPYDTSEERDQMQIQVKAQARNLEGIIQAELNRLLRGRPKAL